MSAPRNMGREAIKVPLARRDGRYEFDWRRWSAPSRHAPAFFSLCSPHNPVGRAFTRPELEQVAAFGERHNLILVSDDIHCDLILDDRPHIPVAALSPAAAARTITLMAPSKTYNIPGLACSFAIISDAKLRTAFTRGMAGIVPEMSVLGLAACEAALRDSEPWRQALLACLRGNRDLIASFTAQHLPGIALTPCEATYLAWLDVSALKLASPGAFFESHGVGLSDGGQFGAPAGSSSG